MIKKILFLLCFLTIFQASCATNIECTREHVKKSLYSSKNEVKKQLNLNDQNKVVRLLFEAPWCNACKRLSILMEQAGVTDKVLRLNIDETWAFVTSRNIGINSVPTLVELRRDHPPIIISGPDKIVMHLLIK